MADDRQVHVAEAHVRSAGGPWRHALDLSGHELVGDEPPRLGGQHTGPGPFDLLGGALAACTNITLRMYAERKGWPLDDVRVDVDVEWVEDTYWFERRIAVEGDLDDTQRARLLDIAERTPVTLVVKGGADVRTQPAPR